MSQGVVTFLLLLPLGPFILAIAAGLTAGIVAMNSGSILAFGAIVLATALVVAVLDLMANLRAPWRGAPTDAQGAAPLVHVAWELVTANVVVIGVVGAAVYGVLLVVPGLR
jgi:hypothetical protein